MTSTRVFLRTCAFSVATLAALSLAPVAAHAAPPPVNTNALVDISLTGGSPNGMAVGKAVTSADGRYVAFTSMATNVTSIDGRGLQQVYLRDLVTNTTRMISSVGTISGDGASYGPSISDDGQTVMYVSDATNITPGATTGMTQAVMWSAATGLSSLVSRATGPSVTGISSRVFTVEVSGSGNSAVFDTEATDVSTDGATGAGQSVYEWNRGGSTKLVASGAQRADVSADGRFVAFLSTDGPSTPGPGRLRQLAVRDTVSGATHVVSTDDVDVDGRISLSADGRYVAFVSKGDSHGAHAGPRNQVFVGDSYSGTVRLASAGLPLTDATSTSPSISADGHRVAYSASGTGTSQVFVTDLTTGTPTVISQSRIRDYGNAASASPVISADGRSVAYFTFATNLSVPATGGKGNVLIRSIG